MTSAKLVLLRHGETEDNKRGLLTGLRDIPLTAEGTVQAQAAAQSLSAIMFDKVYSSPLSRAFNTAAIIVGASSVPVEPRGEIIEMNFGDFTGCEMKTDATFATHVKTAHTYDTPFPGGESEQQVVARVQAFYQAEVMPHLLKGENVLVVAHEGILRAFDIVLGIDALPAAGQSAPKKSVANAVPIVCEYEDGTLKKTYALTPREQAGTRGNAVSVPKNIFKK